MTTLKTINNIRHKILFNSRLKSIALAHSRGLTRMLIKGDLFIENYDLFKPVLKELNDKIKSMELVAYIPYISRDTKPRYIQVQSEIQKPKAFGVLLKNIALDRYGIVLPYKH